MYPAILFLYITYTPASLQVFLKVLTDFSDFPCPSKSALHRVLTEIQNLCDLSCSKSLSIIQKKYMFIFLRQTGKHLIKFCIGLFLRLFALHGKIFRGNAAFPFS
mgnify:CR=1 FL=1